MSNSYEKYECYTITVPVSFFIEATSEKHATDIAMQAMRSTGNFHVVRSAKVDWTSAKIGISPYKTIYHSR